MDEADTIIRPNHRWNNIVHAFWFYSTVVGLVYHACMYLFFSATLDQFAVFLLFEILVALVVIVHLIELALIK